MGTRSLIAVRCNSKTSPELCTIYKHCDGYPEGLGRILFDSFGDFKIVNGLMGEDPKVANGMGCLAAQIITVLKNKVLESSKKHANKVLESSKKHAIAGYVYPIEPDKHDGMAGGVSVSIPGSRGCWEKYIYTLYSDFTEQCDGSIFGAYGELMLEVEKTYGNKILYDGPISLFGEWLEKRSNEDECD